MDYRALAELVMLSLMGLSVFVVAAGFSFKFFLGPVIRDVMERFADKREEGPLRLEMRLDALEGRLDGIEEGIERIAAASEFDRHLESGEKDTP